VPEGGAVRFSARSAPRCSILAARACPPRRRQAAAGSCAAQHGQRLRSGGRLPRARRLSRTRAAP
jgi:hypothetical protein